MDTPGVEIRPLTTIAGSTEFAELFLDEVRVPVANRVGRRERRVAGDHGHPQLRAGHRLRRATCSRPFELLLGHGGAWPAAPGRGPIPAIRRQAGHLRAELDALWALTKRNVSQAARTGIPGVGGTFFKLAYTETRQQTRRVLALPAGPGRAGRRRRRGRRRIWARCPSATMVEDWLRGISLTIAAGTSQIQRNIVGERILGLPKEPSGPPKPAGARTTA